MLNGCARGCLILLLVASASGDAAGVELSRLEAEGKRFTVCQVDLRAADVELFHRDEKQRPFQRLDRLAAWLETSGKRLIFGMNAGMFHSDLSAVGLLVVGGKTLTPLNLEDGHGNFFLKPNGVFALTESGARLLESSEYSRISGKVRLATQSGPLLVRGGEIHPAFRPGSDSRLIRNGVGLPSPDRAVFVISDDPVNFHEFARFFRDVLGCPDALYLDGTVSSLYAPALGRKDSGANLGPMLAITERLVKP